jgi:undecaprenyl-diphosphatase
LGWFVVVATIPAILAGVLIKPYITQIYTMYILISVVLMLGGILMLAAERFGRRTRDLKQLTWLDSIIIGVWQVLALIPGVSRSSATVSGGMLRHFNRADAARFSFLMSIPALLGAGVVALKDLFEVPGLLSSLAGPLVVGFLAAAISGYLSIRWLLGYLKRQSLRVFIIYRFVFGGLSRCRIVSPR